MFETLKVNWAKRQLDHPDEMARREAAENLYRMMLHGDIRAQRALLDRMWDISLHLFVQWGLWQSGINAHEMVEYYTQDLARPESPHEFEQLKSRFRFLPETDVHTQTPELMGLALRTHAGSALVMIGRPSVDRLIKALERSEFTGIHRQHAQTMAAEVLHALNALPPDLQAQYLPGGPQIHFDPERFQ